MWGQSGSFTYTQLASIPPGAADTWMVNFRGFVIVPEPSIVGLAVIGAGALFLVRRRRK